MSDKEIENLRISTRKIILESYKQGGLTIKTYWDPDGNKGKYKPKVYGLNKDEYGNDIIKETFKDGRTTHYVKSLQV